MRINRHRYSLLLLLLILLAPFLTKAQQRTLPTSTPEQIEREFATVPCRNAERLPAVRALFERMGAAPADIATERLSDTDNLLVRKPGATPETIIIGAHYDKTSHGCGAIDNWSGVVALAHLYRTLRDVPTQKTLLFVAFGREEEGLVGSRALANSISREELVRYCAMINLDSLGLAAPQVADNLSSRRLRELATAVASELGFNLVYARLEGAEADSVPFLRRRIPAITIHGLSSDFSSIIHTGNDQSGRVRPASVYLGYMLALGLVRRLEGSNCAAYR